MEDERRAAINASILKIAEGDSRGIDEIYEAIGGRMLSVAIGVVRNRSIAEEVVQDSFVKIVRHASSFRRRENGSAWILKIVRNTALNKLRSEELRSGIPIEENFWIPDPAGERALERSENAMLLQSALETLDAGERRIVCEHYLAERTVREIAKAEGISKSTVARILARAEEKMRRALGP